MPSPVPSKAHPTDCSDVPMANLTFKALLTSDAIAAAADPLSGAKIVGGCANPRQHRGDRTAGRRPTWFTSSGALRAPKQELCVSGHVDSLGRALLLGVGAAFDFHADAKSRGACLDAESRSRVAPPPRKRTTPLGQPVDDDELPLVISAAFTPDPREGSLSGKPEFRSTRDPQVRSVAALESSCASLVAVSGSCKS